MEILSRKYEHELESFKEQNNYHLHDHGECRPLIESMNHMLLSDKDKWHKQLKNIFEESEGNEWQQVLLFRILRKLPEFYEVPLEITQVIAQQLIEIWSPKRKNPGFLGDLWMHEFYLTQEIYDSKLATQINSLDAGEELTRFIANEREQGLFGLRVRGDWDLIYQKDILSFWASHRSLYFKLSSAPVLQYIVEIQIIQTNTIQRFFKFQDDLENAEKVTNWVHQPIFESYREILVNFIKSIKDPWTAMDIMRVQCEIRPYNLKLGTPDQTVGSTQTDSVLVNLCSIFFKMKKLGETPDLQVAIDTLVKRHFIETSEIMEQFLIKVDDHHSFTEENPVLAQFLQYFSEKTQFDLQRKYAIEAISKFHKKVSTVQIRASL
ncbi:hypothetical protein DFH28DRAFT_977719 [Melampsora americana]|nr:hypothetical protein DFH28DRAFT_977719 [Melampsora americana]